MLHLDTRSPAIFQMAGGPVILGFPCRSMRQSDESRKDRATGMCLQAGGVSRLCLEGNLKHQADRRRSVIVANIAVIAGSEKAVAQLHSHSNIRRPVFIDKAAVEEIGIARAAVDERYL